MNPLTGTHRRKVALGAVVVLVMSLAFGGAAQAMYLNDGTKQVAGHYANPGDGFCVSGIKTDGTMTVVPGITNFRDCVAYTSGLTSMVAVDVTATFPSSAVCTKVDGSLSWVAVLQKCFDTSACTVQGAAGNDGAKHAYSTSLCVNASTREGISRLDLDNTAENCQEKGGVLADGLFGHPYGACSAYGWQYGGVKADGTLPDLSGGKGVTSAAGLGFCYTSLRMTSTRGYGAEGTGAGCPSWHNVAAKASAEWTAGTDNVKYQSQTSYDAGLGWTFPLVCAGGPNAGRTCTVATQGTDCPGSTCTSQCLYQYGVKGYLNADLRGPDGAIAPAVTLCAGGTGAATAGTCVDLSGVATQGDCLALGGSWDNWLPVGTGVAPYATNQSVTTSLGCTGGTNVGLACTVATQATDCPGTGGGTCAPFDSTVKKLDATTTIALGGGKFFSGTGSVCERCHSDQSRAYQERQKSGYVDTGHKLSGDTTIFAHVGDPWGLKGVQCEICHATGRPTAQDLGTIIYQTKICVGGTVTTSTPCTSNAQCTGGGTCTAGVPRAASGHNQTEYGSHVTGVCITCHGTVGTPPESTNPASVIPVESGDFKLTAKNLAPIANQFLNSPHAKYASTGNKLDVVTKKTCVGGTADGAPCTVDANCSGGACTGQHYGSTFGGRICRTGTEVTDAATSGNGVDVTGGSTCGAASNLTCNSATNCPATPGGNRVWNAVTSKCYDKGVCATLATPGFPLILRTWDPGTNRCVENSASCTAQSDSGYTFIWSPTGAAGILSTITTTGAGCFKPFAGGNIATTYWDSVAGEAKKIPNLDTATNAACTSTTAGAGGFWTGDGEAAGVTGSVPFPSTDQGNCMTCHDVHWSLNSTDPKAEPIRRDCTTCHSHPTGEASASGAPPVKLATINHVTGAGTPLENWTTEPNEACETCHMPKSSAVGSPMHLWRINTDSTYQTMGSTQANTAADGAYTNAAWVDIDYACGQCHGGSGAPKPGIVYISKPQLALYAKGMHSPTPSLNCSTTFNATVTGLRVDVVPTVNCGGATVDLRYDWAWGEGPDGTAQFDNHTYAAGGTKTIALTVTDHLSGDRVVGTSTRNVAIANPDLPPVIGGSCTVPPGTEWNANTWTMTIVDASSDDGPDADASPDPNPNPTLRIVLDWGDGSTRTNSTQGHTLTHTYLSAGTFTLNETAIDSAVQGVSAGCVTAATPTFFTIQGTVKNSAQTAPISGATVQVKNAATGAIVKTTTTGATGQFSSGVVLKPALYNVVILKSGLTFPVTAVTVGPSDLDFSRTIHANGSGIGDRDDLVHPRNSGKRNNRFASN